jgi:AraC family transcriptional regulator
MNPVEKALWFVETHRAEAISLETIASVAGVSRHHMVRAFGAATGRSVMRYVRGRRLTEAARCLANGAPDILAVALDAGYGSHEAFSRAFRDQFGVTPEAVRAGHAIQPVEPVKMNETPTTLDAPRFEASKLLLIAGLSERYNDQTAAEIPSLWQRFHQSVDAIPNGVGRSAYACAATATTKAILVSAIRPRSPARRTAQRRSRRRSIPAADRRPARTTRHTCA